MTTLALVRITGMTTNPGCFPVKFPELRDEAWLREHYVARRESVYAIARLLGCSAPHVSVSLKSLEIETRPHSTSRIDGEGRECASCSRYQPWSEFYKGSLKAPYGRMASCKTCEKSRPKYTARVRQLARFGITPEEFAGLFQKQGGVCALCFREERRSDPRWAETIWTLAVDHDHRHCGKNRACPQCIRGLLCASCNTMLGRVEEAGEPLVFRFADYLGLRPLLREGGEAQDAILSVSGQ